MLSKDLIMVSKGLYQRYIDSRYALKVYLWSSCIYIKIESQRRIGLGFQQFSEIDWGIWNLVFRLELHYKECNVIWPRDKQIFWCQSEIEIVRAVEGSISMGITRVDINSCHGVRLTWICQYDDRIVCERETLIGCLAWIQCFGEGSIKSHKNLVKEKKRETGRDRV